MEIGKVRLLLIIGAPLAAILIGVSGYFIYSTLTQQHLENRQSLESFGEQIIPMSDKGGASDKSPEELAPSIYDGTESPTQRVIITLKEERIKLLAEAAAMRQEIIDLKAQVADLANYKHTNERYAPHTFNEEVSTVHTRIKQLLATREETQRFNSRQVSGMAAASAKEYRRFLVLNKLTLEPKIIDDVVNNHLPVYAFCIGDGIEIAANNKLEETLLVEHFKTGSTKHMSSRLQSDLQAILEPCQQLLAKRLSFLIR